jgi:hypothetical protein
MTSKHTSFFMLLEELQQPGCALCRLGATAANRFLDALLYEYVNDFDMRRTLQASHGFCPTHSVALVSRHDALGTSILYNSVLARLQTELEALETVDQKGVLDRLRDQLGSGAGSDALLAAEAGCPACDQRDEATSRALGIMAKHAGDEELVAALKESGGFCLPHLRVALNRLTGPARDQIRIREQEVLQALRDELGEAIRKYDYRFQGEGFGAEEDAWRRAVEVTAGMPGVF